ncbi:MAG: Z1 domain-containing protein [Nannocystaceae bacterium]
MVLPDLKTLFDADFMPVMEARAAGELILASFEELKPYIKDALSTINVDGDPVLIVNSDKEIQAQQKKLDFETDKVWRTPRRRHPAQPRLTVEGLTISYFRRKGGLADTHASWPRWFGFSRATKTSCASTSVVTFMKLSRRSSLTRRRPGPNLPGSTPVSTISGCLCWSRDRSHHL